VLLVLIMEPFLLLYNSILESELPFDKSQKKDYEIFT